MIIKEEMNVRKWGVGQTSPEIRKMFLKDVDALIQAVREDCIKGNTPKYSGYLSRPFWRLVGSIKNEIDHDSIYSLGCDLQYLEHRVLGGLKLAIKGNANINKASSHLKRRAKNGR